MEVRVIPKHKNRLAFYTRALYLVIPVIILILLIILSIFHEGFYTRYHLPFIFGTTVVLILFVYLGNFLVHREVSAHLTLLTESITTIDLISRPELYGIDRNDEIGILARTIVETHEIIRHQNSLKMENDKVMNERVRIILDSAPIMIDYCDENFNIIDCNQTAVDFYGYASKEDYCSDGACTILKSQPDGISSEECRIKHMSIAFEKGYNTFEFVDQKLNGETVYLEVACIRAKYNDIPVIIAYFNDITYIKENERITEHIQKALVRREELLRTVNQAASALLAVEDKNSFQKALIKSMEDVGRCLVVDRMHLIRTSTDEEGISMSIIGKWLSETGKKEPFTDFNRKFPHGAFKKFEELVSERGFFSGLVSELPHEEQNFGNPFGTTKSTAIIPLILDEQLWGVCTIDDCTNERDFSEDEVNIVRSAALMTVSTFRRIEQEAEMHRIEIAEESSKAKSRFLARMSHEIRTPISTVMGVSEIQLQSTNLSPQIEEAFAKIHSSASLLLGIVNDILDHTKIEAGKMTIQHEKYNIASVISDVAQLYIVHLGSKNIKFSIHVDENLPYSLIGDVLRIEQVINNLLSNAFKYTEAGFVELSLYCQNVDGDDNSITLIVTIRDTGLGMTPEQLKDLFAEYTRFHELETRAIVGTGLGMSIVHSLVQLMEAKLDITSEVGKGTLVVVSIPQKKAGKHVLGREAALRLQQFEAYVQTAAKKFNFVPEPMPYGSVLVVDDIDANLYVANGLLAFYDLNVETCSNGHEAIDKISKGKVYDVIFMDQLMPGIDGTETMIRLRKMGYTQPIVTLTANALIGQAEQFIEMGFDGFISKPIQTSHLNSILTKYIRDKQPLEVTEAARAKKRQQKSTKPNVETQDNINDYLSSNESREKLRLDFAKNQKNSFINICEALDSGDIKTAHRLAHSLKGVAGLINEHPLVIASEIVEHLLQDEKIPTQDQLSAIEYELTRVLDDIGKPEATLPSASTKEFTKTDKNNALTIFNELEKLLKHHNADSLNFLDKLRLIPETAVLNKQLEDYDFGAALVTLGVLKSIFEDL